MSGTHPAWCARQGVHSVPSECTAATVTRARWFPSQPPMLAGEDIDAYTGRLTGCQGPELVPYDHPRNRQCSIGYHGECSERREPLAASQAELAAASGRSCQCPCHTEAGRAQLRVDELEELVAALWFWPGGGRGGRMRPEGQRVAVQAILAAHPEYVTWYGKD